MAHVTYKPRGERSLSDALIPLGGVAFTLLMAVLALIFLI